jgi:hypothetical protein
LKPSKLLHNLIELLKVITSEKIINGMVKIYQMAMTDPIIGIFAGPSIVNN